jgi:Tol biopolymer transport system component
MKLIGIGLSATLLAAALAFGAQKQDDAERQLKAAMNTELVDGNLKAAIEQYKKVAESRNRAVAVEALVHMAECYQKLGDSESRRIYERIIRDYGDQKTAVSTARDRLGISAKAGMTSRQIALVSIGGVGYGSISPDGRYFPYTNWENGDLFLRDFMTGADRRITNASALLTTGEFAAQSTFSKDGKLLAYGWFNGKRYEIRIVSVESSGASQPRRIFVNEDIQTIFPDDWSSDGKWLAVQIRREDRSTQIGLLAIQDGSLHILKSIDWRGATRLMFSPDSKYLAYDRPSDEKTNDRDIFILRVDGTRELAVAPHPGNDVVMGWSPSGDYLLFASNRAGQTGLWEVQYKDGKVASSPEALKPEIAGAPLGVTTRGFLYSLLHHPSFNSAISSNIRIADFDFSTGRLVSEPVAPVQTFIGANNSPRWSPDGKYLAYVSSRPENLPGSMSQRLGRNVIGIRSVADGQIRELRPALALYPPNVEWSADGRSFLTQGTDVKGRQGIYRIDAQSGEIEPIVISNATSSAGEFRRPVPSPDGRKVYYNASRTTILARDLVTGNETTVIKGMIDGPFALSPDGKYLATTNSQPSKHSFVLLLVNTSDGTHQEINVDAPNRMIVEGWTADSAAVVVRKQSASDPTGELWKMPIDGGSGSKLGLNVHFQTSMSVHPNGRQIAYAVAEPAKADEVWVLENFLPAR